MGSDLVFEGSTDFGVADFGIVRHVYPGGVANGDGNARSFARYEPYGYFRISDLLELFAYRPGYFFFGEHRADLRLPAVL